MGAKPSEIACLSIVSSNIQTQLNSKQLSGYYLSSSSLTGYLTSDSLGNYPQYAYVNSISSFPLKGVSYLRLLYFHLLYM